MSSPIEPEVHCANCGIRITWPALRRGEDVYCCPGCAMGGPCYCSYDRPGQPGPMKMVLAIVPREDDAAVLQDLVSLGYRATKIASTGAFLRRGNSVVMVGVDASLVDVVVEAIRRRCRTRKWPLRATAVPIPSEAPPPADEVTVGGATIFVLDVERHERL